MKIETKYNIGQEVWYLGDKNEPRYTTILNIDIEITTGVKIFYEIWVDDWIEEHNLFFTKEELLKSL